MLSQESAVGQYPVGAVAMMAAIAERTELTAPYREWNERRVRRDRRDPAYTLAYTACRAAHELGLAALVCPTLSGRSARLISAHRPTVPIYALSPGRETVRRCGLMWGVQAASMPRMEVTEELIRAQRARASSSSAGSSPASASASRRACPRAGRGRRACCRSRPSERVSRRRRPPARPSSRLRRVAVHPLARDPVEVGRQRSCDEHGEREHLDAAAEQVVGGQRLVAHLAEVLRARVGHVDHHLRRDLRRERRSPRRARTTTSRRGTAPAACRAGSAPGARGSRSRPRSRAAARRRPRGPARWQASSSSISSLGMTLKRPKSRNATGRPPCSMKLPGCGSPENWWWRYMQPKKKRKTISPTRSRVAWSIVLDRVEAGAAHELA